MSNITENRISTVFTTADMTAMATSINTLIAMIPENTTLSDDERNGYNAIDVSNKIFVEDVVIEANITGTDIVPNYINLPELQKDLTIFSQLDTIEAGLMNALQRIKDAKRIAGHEAYKVSNVIYRAYQTASENGVPNAKSSYDKLKLRYQSQTNTSSTGRPPAENPII
jgi:hypothetical protein